MSIDDGRARLSALIYYGAVLLLAYLVYRIFEPFLVPLGWAIVLVVCFHPVHARFLRRWGRQRAAAASTLAVVLVLVIPGLILLGGFLREAVIANQALAEAHGSAAAPLIAATEQFAAWLHQHFPSLKQVDPMVLVQRGTELIGGWLAERAASVARDAAIFALDFFIMLFALYYLFRDSATIVDAVRRILPFDHPQREQMLAQARDLISASVTASLVIAVVQGVIGGASFTLVGLPAPIFWGTVMAFFALLPMVGSGIIWVPAAVWLLTQGHIWGGITLALACGVAAGTIDHFVRPILLSGHARMSPLLVFISVVGGIAVFGMLGFVLGPIVMATAASIFGVYTSEDTKHEPSGRGPGVVVQSRPGRA